MAALGDLSNVELEALVRLVDAFPYPALDGADEPDPRPAWRALLHGEVRRRMLRLAEGQRILDEARAARASAG